MNTEIYEYIVKYRKNRNKKIGLLFAKKGEDGSVRIGWALCRQTASVTKDGTILLPDKFSMQRALEMCHGRVNGTSAEIPQTVQSLLPVFIERCRRYFKVEKHRIGVNRGNKEVAG